MNFILCSTLLYIRYIYKYGTYWQPAECTFIGTKCPKYIFGYGTHSSAIIKFIQNNGLEVKLKTVDKNRKIELNQEMRLLFRLYHHDDLFVLNYTFLFQPLLVPFVCSFKVIFIFHPYIHNVVQILKEINTTYYFVCVTRRFKQTYFMEGGSFKLRKITRIFTKCSNTPICKVYY